MAKKTPDQIAEKYGRRLAASGQDYTEGVLNPSRDWADATRQGEGRWKQGLAEAQQNGAFTRGVQKAGSEKWKQAAAGKGAQRFTASALEAKQAFAQQAGQIMAAGDVAKGAVAAMDNTTIEARIQRGSAANMAIHRYWKGRAGAGGVG